MSAGEALGIVGKSARSSTVGAEWETPIPLTGDRRVPDFPVHAMPDVLRDFVEQTARALQTPPDLPGVLVMAVLSAVTGGRLEVKARPGWREPTNMYTVVVLPPGERKSAAFAAASRPLFEVERDMVERTRHEIVEATARADALRRFAAAKPKKTPERDDSEARSEFLAEAVALHLEADAVVVPVTPRLIADDATPEAIASLLASQGGRIAVMSPEAEIFDIMAGRYSGRPNLGVFLKGHAGDHLRVDRRGAEPYTVERPALTLGLAVQPDVLQAINDRPGFRGRGFLARVLWSFPVSRVGYREIAPASVDDAVRVAYESMIREIATTLSGWTDPAVVALSPGAQGLLVAFEQRIEPSLRPAGSLGSVSDWGAKLAGAAVRIAGLLHVASHPSDAWRREVDAATMTAAIELADYFTDHAVVVFDYMGADPPTSAARLLLRWIIDRDAESFSRREAHRAHQARFPKATDMDPALQLLQQLHWIRLRAAQGSPAGGRPSRSYDVNPIALAIGSP